MWWRAEFPSLNWVVCLSHWSPLPGKRFRFCAKTGETLHLGLFLTFPCGLLPYSLLVSQPGGSSTGENDWQVSVGASQGLCGGSRFTFGADRQAGSCHNLQPLLQGRFLFSGFVLMPQALFNIFFSLQDETVDLRHVYFSVAALSGLVSFKSLLFTAFPVRIFCQSLYSFRSVPHSKSLMRSSFLSHQFFDKEGRGSLSAEDLSDLMGALLGVPQHNIAELYAAASNHGCLTEGKLWFISVFWL